MYLTNRKLDIRNINEDDFIRNKNSIIILIEDNLKLNFPDIDNVAEFAISAYEDMIRFKRDNSAILVGAFEENALIGFLWAYIKSMFGEDKIHIAHIVVSSKARSSGIGSKLISNLEEISKMKGIKKLELMTTKENDNALKFYLSKGFTTVRVQLEKVLDTIDDNR